MKLFEDGCEVIPIGNMVILKREETKERSEGGIWLAERAQEKSMMATVLATGPGQAVGGVFQPATVVVGDKVLVDKIGGFELEVGDEKYLVVREPEIICIIRSK